MTKMIAESLEMEPLTEKHMRRSLDDSFSDENEEDDIIVHGSDDGPNNEDRQLLNEEDEREKLLTRKRGKVFIGSRKHARKRSIESRIEDGLLSRDRKLKRRRCSLKRMICCLISVFGLVILVIVIVLFVRVFSRPVKPRPSTRLPTLSNGTNKFMPTVLIISLDGFRPDYIDEGVTPNLYRLREMGVAPEYMKPSFPSVTFPNHYSIVTGLYPESHGVVGNEFFDPELRREFDIGDPAKSLASWWWEGTSGGFVEPIWNTAERQGLISAIHMWPGSEAVIHGQQASYVDKFSLFETLSNKVSRVLSWLDMDDLQRPSFIAAYVPNIDTVGHHFGPWSPEMNSSLVDVDGMIGDIMDGLDARNLTDIVNLIVVSDHGMAESSEKRLIYLDSLLDLNLIEHFDCWPLKGLRPVPSENITGLYDHLKPLSDGQPWNVYLRDVDMPPRWHFSATYRIAPLFIVPDPGWVILNSKEEFDPEEDYIYQPRGIHGYDNDDEMMRALFVASGPAFRYNYSVAPFDNVEVYGMMTNILGIKPNPSNATLPKGRMQRLQTSLATVPTEGDDDIDASTDMDDFDDEDGIPDMTAEDWAEVESDLETAEEEGGPLTWKEYLEYKAEEMREELAVWWYWIKHGGTDDDDDY